jgi:hypothetical protein
LQIGTAMNANVKRNHNNLSNHINFKPHRLYYIPNGKKKLNPLTTPCAKGSEKNNS